MLSKQIHPVKAVEKTGKDGKEISTKIVFSNKVKRKKHYIVKCMKSKELCMKYSYNICTCLRKSARELNICKM